MGKAEEEQPLPHSFAVEYPQRNAEGQCCGCGCVSIRKFVGFRCIFVLLLSAAVFLSAAFWLPPFLQYADQKDLRPDSKYKGHDIAASFIVKKPVSLLQDNILQLEDDIYEEIGVLSTKVVILSLEPFSGSNMTRVVFAVDPDDKYPEMSSAAVRLVRDSFQDLVVGRTIFQLTTSLFGDTFQFEVLRFRGGITIIPDQSAFLLQKVQSLFNFTLNFSIYQIQMNFNELRSQLKSGLHLSSYENLYVSLSNYEGSTVAAPTILQSFGVLAIGNLPLSKQRLKQLAQTIEGSHSRNLGLNNTQFGRVKQVRLSSILQHSLGGDGSGVARSPSPSPLPHPHYHHHHHHHHHHQHHHHHHNADVAPAVSSTPAPATGIVATPPKIGSPTASNSVSAPGRSSQAEPPNCGFGHRKRSGQNPEMHAHLTPAVAPTSTPHYSAASPKQPAEPPPHVYRSVPALSPLPNVAFAHSEPPPKNEPAAERPNNRFHGPTPSLLPSSPGHHQTLSWALPMFVVLLLHL